MTTVPRLLPTLAAAALLAAAATNTAHAAVHTLDLRDASGFQIVGAAPGDHASLAGPAGDVNGDGRADVLVAAYNASTATRRHAGAAYVVFGRARKAGLRRAVLRAPAPSPVQGFRIVGGEAEAQLSLATAAGDLDGDGLGDLLVGGQHTADHRGGAYVVFGKRDGRTVDLRRLGRQGVRLRLEGGPMYAFSAGQDVNGDGRPDLLVSGSTVLGADKDAYVLFGGTLARGDDLTLPADLGARGYALHHANGRAQLIPDMNGDGRAEVATATATSETQREVVRVAYGKADPAAVDMDGVGAGGFAVVDPRPSSTGVGSFSGGDVNGDGLGDLILGTTLALVPDAKLRKDVNRVTVIFGAPSADVVSLVAPSPRLLSVRMPAQADPFLHVDGGAVHNGFTFEGMTAATVGDLDGDGLADLTFNDPGNPRGRRDAGSIWIVRGRREAGSVSLTLLARHGDALRIDGAYPGDGLNGAAAPVGDFDGDGRPDLAVAAGGATRNGRAQAGLAYIIPVVRP